MGKTWKKLWLTRKVAAAKKVVQEVVDVVEETVKTTKKTKKTPFWKKKKDN